MASYNGTPASAAFSRIFSPIGAKPHIAVECDGGSSLLIVMQAGRGIALCIPVFELVTGKRLPYRPIGGKAASVPIGIASATKGDVTSAGEIFCENPAEELWIERLRAKSKPGTAFSNPPHAQCPVRPLCPEVSYDYNTQGDPSDSGISPLLSNVVKHSFLISNISQRF
jgi:hypothetical protein